MCFNARKDKVHDLSDLSRIFPHMPRSPQSWPYFLLQATELSMEKQNMTWKKWFKATEFGIKALRQFFKTPKFSEMLLIYVYHIYGCSDVTFDRFLI